MSRHPYHPFGGLHDPWARLDAGRRPFAPREPAPVERSRVSPMSPRPLREIERERDDLEESARAPAPKESGPSVVGEIARDAAIDHDLELRRARERLERDAERRIEHERREVLRDFIEIVDDLDRAAAAAADAGGVSEGIELVRRRFLDKLERHGVRRVAARPGDRFDPQAHEAIAAVPAPGRAGRILEVSQPAYFVGEELLRPAQVVVGRD